MAGSALREHALIRSRAAPPSAAPAARHAKRVPQRLAVPRKLKVTARRVFYRAPGGKPCMEGG